MSDLSRNYALIRERMEAACRKAGRSVDEVRMLAVSKYVPIARLQEAAEAGVHIFGENHAQELNEKQTFFEHHACEVHFIGQLQTNKLKYVCGSVTLIESVDRQNLLEALERRSASLGVVSDILIQVNIGGEPQKGGVAGEDLGRFADMAAERPHIRMRGLMCVPPALDAERVRPYFARMRGLFERMQSVYDGFPIDTLSMGMSHDYEAAILEGATQVRIGTALFGARDQK